MITPHHIIYNLALLDSKDTSENAKKINKKTWAIALGAFFPDSFTFLFFLIYGVMFSMPHQKMWDDLYFNSPWNNVFNLSHSMWLLPLLTFIFYIYKWRNAMYFFLSATIHALMDFCVHADDAYKHFYPFSNFKFQSPISYYDPQFYGNYVSLGTHVLAIIALYFLYKRALIRKSKTLAKIYAIIGILEVVVVIVSAYFLFK